MEQCANLINSEWPRSLGARLRSLEASCEYLPTSLVLCIHNCTKVLAHLKLTPVPSDTESCFVESVIVDQAYRGNGLGKIIMQYAEEYCRTYLRLQKIYLSTVDQVGFYKRLNYTECPPINMYGRRSYSVAALRKMYMVKEL